MRRFIIDIEVDDDHPALAPDPLVDIDWLIRTSLQEHEKMRVVDVRPADVGDEGEKLRQRRMELGLTVRALAEQANVDRGNLAAIEAGRRQPRSSTLGHLHRVLDELSNPRTATPTNASQVRFEVTNAGGTRLTVSCSLDDAEDVADAVARLMGVVRAT